MTKSTEQIMLEACVKRGGKPLVIAGRSVVEVRVPRLNGALGGLVEAHEREGRHPVVLCGRLFVDQEEPRRRKAPKKPARTKKAPRRRGTGASR